MSQHNIYKCFIFESMRFSEKSATMKRQLIATWSDFCNDECLCYRNSIEWATERKLEDHQNDDLSIVILLSVYRRQSICFSAPISLFCFIIRAKKQNHFGTNRCALRMKKISIFTLSHRRRRKIYWPITIKLRQMCSDLRLPTRLPYSWSCLWLWLWLYQEGTWCWPKTEQKRKDGRKKERKETQKKNW